jgi:hypothetical protein
MVRSLEIGGDVMMHRVQMINFPHGLPSSLINSLCNVFTPMPSAQAPQPSYPSAPPQPYAPPPAHYPSLGLGPTQNSYPPPQPEVILTQLNHTLCDAFYFSTVSTAAAQYRIIQVPIITTTIEVEVNERQMMIKWQHS